MSTWTTNHSGTPLVSILMPFYNAQETVEAAIRSILLQDYPHWELLMVDDGSTDKSREYVRLLKDSRIVTWSDGTRQGLAPRLNECVTRARGIYLARMDSDDISYPARLGRQVEFLQQHADVDLVGCSVVVFGEDGSTIGKRIVPATHAEIAANPLSGFGMAHPTWMGRREWFQSNLYDPGALRYEDYQLLHRTYTRSTFANLPDLLFGYREPRGGWQKRAKTRFGRIRYLYQEQGADPRFWNAAARESMKAVADGTIVVTGRRYSALQMSTQRLTAEEEATWNQVLQQAMCPMERFSTVGA